jgi:hypothetical protein
MTWRAEIILSSQSEPVCHVQAWTTGDSKEDALAGAQFIFDKFGSGCERLVRAYPEADSEKNFDTRETRHRGYVRFSIVNRPGVDMAATGIVPISLGSLSIANG